MGREASCHILADEQELRSVKGPTMDIAVHKSRPKLDQHCREFIRRSPFLCLGTAGADGRADVSPRGDPAGFVQIIDDNHLFIPDRPGNNRLDSMSNIMANPNVGLLFIIPGFDDTLRVNGKARIVQDETLAQKAIVNGKPPQVGILVEVEEAFLHCAKAFKRSRLWDPNHYQKRAEMPSLAHMILDQLAPPSKPPNAQEIKEADEFVEDNYITGLY